MSAVDRNKKIIIVGILMGLASLLILLAFVFFAGQSANIADVTRTPDQTESSSSESIPSVYSNSSEESKDPVRNGVYLVKTFDERYAIEDWAMYFNDFLRFKTHGASVDFKDLVNPRKLIVLDQTVNYDMGTFYYDENSDYVYFSIVSRPNSESINQEMTGYIYQVSIDSRVSNILWSRRLLTNDQLYGDMLGTAGPELVADDKYIALSVGSCYACGPGPGDMSGLIILNIQTGAEKYLGKVGNPRFNLSTNTVTANEYILVDEPCEIGYACDTGTWKVAKTEGKEITFDLP